MIREYALLGVDIGATNIKCAMGVRNEDTHVIDIISAYTVPTLGIRDGFMEDRDALLDVIRQGINRVQDSALCKPKEVLFSISSRYFYTLDVSASVPISEGHVTHKNVLHLIEACHTAALQLNGSNANYAITHTLPQNFILDAQNTSLSPWGKPALQVDLNAHLVYGHKETINAFWDLGDTLKLPMRDISCNLLVQAESLLSKKDLEKSVAILDIGSETTKVMIFNEGRPIYFHSRFQGGTHITQEIQHQLNISNFDDAENLKLMHGVIRSEGGREMPRIPIYNEGPTRYIRQETLTRILERALTENLSAIRVRLEEDQMDHYLKGGVILSGGTSNIRGLDRLTAEILQTTARIGLPIQSGVKDLVHAPQYAAVNGLVLAGLRERYNSWFSIWRRPLKSVPIPYSRYEITHYKSWWKRLLKPQKSISI